MNNRPWQYLSDATRKWEEPVFDGAFSLIAKTVDGAMSQEVASVIVTFKDGSQLIMRPDPDQ